MATFATDSHRFIASGNAWRREREVVRLPEQRNAKAALCPSALLTAAEGQTRGTPGLMRRTQSMWVSRLSDVGEAHRTLSS